MFPNMPGATDEATDGAAADDLRASARGWNAIQLAALGFIGLCGVLQGERDLPFSIDVAAGVLAVLALVVAGAAVVLVGVVAWPLRPTGESRRQMSRLRLGIVLTFVATALIATSALSGWWPERSTAAGTALVQVRDIAGRSWCGELTDPVSGALTLTIGSRQVTLPARTIAQVRPVQSC